MSHLKSYSGGYFDLLTPDGARRLSEQIGENKISGTEMRLGELHFELKNFYHKTEIEKRVFDQFRC